MSADRTLTYTPSPFIHSLDKKKYKKYKMILKV